MTPKQEAALRLARASLRELVADPQVDFAPAYEGARQRQKEALAAIDEALAEQQSGIKQVIELYDSPEQPAQQDYWQEEARRYAQNAEFWRGKYEAATAQQQEPVAWLHPANATCVTTDPTAYARGIPLYTSPQPSKPWVGLTDEQISNLWCEVTNTDFVTADTHEFARAIEAKLREKNA